MQGLQDFESHTPGTRETRNSIRTGPRSEDGDDNIEDGPEDGDDNIEDVRPLFQEVDETMAPNAVDNLIDKIIGSNGNDPLKKSLEEDYIYTLHQLISIGPEVIEQLRYNDNGHYKDLRPNGKRQVRMMSQYMLSKMNNGEDITDLDIYSVDEFNTFCLNYTQNAVSQSSTAAKTTATNTKAKDDLLAFSRHRKLSVETYPVIKIDYEFTSKMIIVRSFAKVDKIDRVFDLNVKPGLLKGDDKQLFAEQAIYAMVVARSVFKSPTAKQYFRTHPEDVRAFFEAYSEHVNQSPATETHFHGELGTFIKYPISEHKGSRLTYLDAADEMFVRYDENNMTPIHNDMKIVFLKQAVLDDEHLKTVYDECFESKRKTTPPNQKVSVDYGEYKMKLRQRAEALDNKSSTTRNGNNSTFLKSLNVSIDSTTHANQVSVNQASIATTGSDDSGTDEFLLEGPSGEVHVFKSVKHNRFPKSKTFVKKEAFGKNEGLKREWINAGEDVRNSIFEEMLQRHLIKKNSELKVVAAASVPASDVAPIVNHNYYANFTDAFQYEEDQATDTVTVQAVKKASTAPPAPTNLKEKDKGPLQHGHPHKFLANKRLEVRDPKTQKVVGNLIVNAAKTVLQNVAYMSENERYHVAKLIGMSRLDAIHDSLDIPPMDSPTRASVIQVRNSVFQLKMALIDRGANGTLIAKDMHFVPTALPTRYVNVVGAGDHTTKDHPIGSGIGKAVSDQGVCLVYAHEGAHMPQQEHSILSAVQLEDYGCVVDETSIRFGGTQTIKTPDGHIFPLQIKDGLCYLPMQRPTQADLDNKNFPHVILTSDVKWDPSKYNDLIDIAERLRDFPKSVSTDARLEYTPTGKIVQLNTSSVETNVSTSERVDPESIEPVSSTDPPNPSHSDWDLCFGSDDEPAAVRLHNHLHHLYDDQIENLQAFVNGFVFNDALQDIDSRFDLPSNDATCNWHTVAAASFPPESSTSSSDGVKSASSPSKSYDRLADLSIALPYEHEFWYSDRFLTHPVATRCFYSGILDHYARFGINASEIHSAVPSLPRTVRAVERDYESLRPNFCFLPADRIRKTFEHTSQNMIAPPPTNLKKYYRTRNPASGIACRDEDDCIDECFSDVPAVDGGETSFFLIVGRKSHVLSAHKSKGNSEEDALKAFQDRVITYGRPRNLRSDNARLYRGSRWKQYLRDLWIGMWHSESYYQHQNFIERFVQIVLRMVNRLMERTGARPGFWFFAVCLICSVLNHCIDPNLPGVRSPLMMITGHYFDISPFLNFRFNEPVYFLRDSTSFPSESSESRGIWLGPADNVGTDLCYNIYDQTTGKIVERSAVRSALTPELRNLTEDPISVTRLNPGEHTSDKKNSGEPSSGESFSGELPSDSPIPTSTPASTPSPRSPPTFFADRSDDPPFATGTKVSRSNDGVPTSGVIQSFDSDSQLYLLIYSDGSSETLSHYRISKDRSPVPREIIRRAKDDGELQRRSSNLDAFEKFKVVLRDEHGKPRLDKNNEPITVIAPHPDMLESKTFLTHADERGEIKRGRIVEALNKHEAERLKDPTLIKFKVHFDTEETEDIMTYNDILDYIARGPEDDNGETYWNYRNILGHQHTPRGHKDRNGAEYNVQIEWETGEILYHPLDAKLAADCKFDLAKYGRENDLLDEPGWRRFRKLAQQEKKMLRMIKQSKLRSFHHGPKYMNGFQVPNNFKEALFLDDRNENNHWEIATDLEIDQLIEFKVFKDRGKYHKSRVPRGYRVIPGFLIYAVKHDGRFKARYVAGGHKTDAPIENVHSGVISLKGLRTIIFIGELNGMEAWGTDISNAYLNAECSEYVAIVAGEEFKRVGLAGHLLIVHKALYGLKSSGKRFNEHLGKVLRKFGFERSRAENDIWIRECPTDNVYEYIGTYVDDLCIIMRNPEEFLEQLEGPKGKFKLKGSGPLKFHLGCGFTRDSTGTLCMDAGKYVQKMQIAYKQLFGTDPPKKNVLSPLMKGDHPELDTSEFLDEDGILIYQSLIGSMQWSITLGRYDIQCAVMTLSRFRALPRKGHLDRAKRVYGYLIKFKDFMIRFRTDEPDYDDHEIKRYDWLNTPYGNPTEEIPTDAPTPKGNRVVLTHYYDANLMHDVLNGKAVTGCLHFYNKTPIDWFSKLQATAETATYGAEFVAARTCIEQIIEHRQFLRYLGVPICNISYVFGDNETQINSATLPHARLHKRHNILSYHFVRNMIACGYINLHHLRSEYNLADVLSKHWGHQNTYELLLKPIFHCIGDVGRLITGQQDVWVDESLFDDHK